jgi:hypothetical protein
VFLQICTCVEWGTAEIGEEYVLEIGICFDQTKLRNHLLVVQYNTNYDFINFIVVLFHLATLIPAVSFILSFMRYRRCLGL